MESQSFTGTISVKKTTIKWKIENFLDVIANEKTSIIVESPEFHSNDLKWQILLYPNGESKLYEGYLSSTLTLIDCKKNFTTNFKFSIINKNKVTCYSRTGGIRTFSESNWYWTFYKFIKREELMSNTDLYLPKGHLTFLCEIVADHYDNYSGVALNFGHMFNNKKYSDVQFMFDKGEVIHAHKLILANKSNVFSTLFEDSALKEVGIDNVEYKTFLEMLRFMYTSRVNNIKHVAVDLVPIAFKYQLSDLIDLCAEFLIKDLSCENAVRYLDLAISYEICLLKTKTVNFIMANSDDMKMMPEFRSIVELDKNVIFQFICSLTSKVS